MAMLIAIVASPIEVRATFSHPIQSTSIKTFRNSIVLPIFLRIAFCAAVRHCVEVLGVLRGLLRGHLADDHHRGLFRVKLRALVVTLRPAVLGFLAVHEVPQLCVVVASCRDQSRRELLQRCLDYLQKEIPSPSVTPECGKCSKSQTLRSHFGKTIAKSSRDAARLKLFNSDCNSAACSGSSQQRRPELVSRLVHP